MIFQGILTSIAKKPYIFVIFQGGGPGPLSPPLDLRMLTEFTVFLKNQDTICCFVVVVVLIIIVQSMYWCLHVVYRFDRLVFCCSTLQKNTVKPVLSGHSKRRPIIGFQVQLSLNAGQKYCRMLQESILQYFRPSLSYNLILKPLCRLFMSNCLRHILWYWASGSSWCVSVHNA